MEGGGGGQGILAGSLTLRPQTGHFVQRCFRQAEKGAVNKYPCGFLTNVCFGHFI